MKQANVLVIADQGDFAQMLMGRWHSERNVPAFTRMNSDVFHADAAGSCDLILVGPVAKAGFATLLTKLAALTQPVIVVAAEQADAAIAGASSARIMVLRQHEGWVDLLILLAGECLRRMEATERAEKAEEAAAEAAAHATLGLYMLEMRHSLNNALTSVLGNAELMLLDPGKVPEEIREQLATIRSMSLRMNEILARFSSLEMELKFAKREAKGDAVLVRSQTAGWTSF